MSFRPTELDGAFLVEADRLEDERGLCARASVAPGPNFAIAQSATSFNKKRGTLRGLPYQVAPREQAKVVRCVRRAVHEVIIDLRSASSTFQSWIGEHLAARDLRSLWIPEGFVGGYLTLKDECAVTYHVSFARAPEAERGVRWDDPAFSLEWPLVRPVMSSGDTGYSDFLF